MSEDRKVGLEYGQGAQILNSGGARHQGRVSVVNQGGENSSVRSAGHQYILS